MPRPYLLPSEAKRRRKKSRNEAMKRQRRAMRRRVEERLEAERHLLMDTDSDSANDETDEVEQQEHVREPFEPDEAMNVDPQDGHLVAHGPVGPAGDGNAEPQEIEMHSDEGHSTASEGDQVVPPLNPIQFYSTTQVPPEERKAELCRALAAVKAQTLTTDSGMDKMLKVIVSRIDTVKELVESNQLGCSYRFSVKPVAMKGTPRFRYSLLIQDGTTEPPTVYVKKELKTIPQEYINLGPNDKRIVLRQDGYTTLKDIKKFHRKVLKSRGVADEVFQRHCMNLDLSVDGVRETNYGQRTFSIMSARLGATIYILKVHNYLIGNADSKPTLEESFRSVINELAADPELRLRNLVADTPERHTCKGLIAQSGQFSCETCVMGAVTTPAIHWPYPRCFGGALRTEAEHAYSARHLDDVEHDHQGVNAYSPLNEVPGPFSILWNIPPDSFHLVKEGVGKLMIKRLLEDSTKLEAREIMAEWTEMYLSTRVFTETPRYSRKINTSKLKGSELGILVFSAFPALALLMDEGRSGHWKHAKKCVAIFTFLVRAYNFDNARYEGIKDLLAEQGTSYADLHEKFYESFMAGVCTTEKQRATTNIHTFSHLHLYRERLQQPLYELSAEPFEAE